MTRKWVKDELKKNPVADAVMVTAKYATDNKNNIVIGIVIIVIGILFVTVVIKNKMKETKSALRIYSFAQNDFNRFNYSSAIEKYTSIEKEFSNTSIIPQVKYFKGLSYYKQGNLQKAENILKNCLRKYKKSKIVSQVRITLGAVFEDKGEYEEALKIYSLIPDDEYLKPEALSGMARIYEIIDKKSEAVEIYTKLQSHYVNTYWGNYAKERLESFGMKLSEKKDQSLNFEVE